MDPYGPHHHIDAGSGTVAHKGLSGGPDMMRQIRGAVGRVVGIEVAEGEGEETGHGDGDEEGDDGMAAGLVAILGEVMA